MVGSRRVLALLLFVSVGVGACAAGDGGASAAPGLRFAVFLGQMLAAREAIESSVAQLVDAGNGTTAGLGPDDVRTAADSLAGLVADQRAWLADNPPAACYAAAHGAADTVSDALDEVAAAALDWADAMGSTDSPDAATAYAAVVAAGRTALAEANDLGTELEAVSCLE